MCLSCWAGTSQETSTSLTASIFPLIASILPAKNRKMAPCKETHEDGVSTGYRWDGVTSGGWSHLGVSVQVGLQQLLCFLDVDISSTCGWQGDALLRFPLPGPVLLLATCHGLLGASVFPSVKWHDSPYLWGDRRLEQANVYTVRAHHRLTITWEPFLSLQLSSSHLPLGGTITLISQRKPAQGGQEQQAQWTWFCRVLGA